MRLNPTEGETQTARSGLQAAAVFLVATIALGCRQDTHPADELSKEEVGTDDGRAVLAQDLARRVSRAAVEDIEDGEGAAAETFMALLQMVARQRSAPRKLRTFRAPE